jgi:hypothetical protein
MGRFFITASYDFLGQLLLNITLLNITMSVLLILGYIKGSICSSNHKVERYRAGKM